MHFVVAWDIKVKVDGKTRSLLQEQLRDAISGHSWVRPIANLYIVKVTSSADLDSIRRNLVAVAESHPGILNFIITPLMEGGDYRGWLPAPLWPKIRARTQ